MARKHDASYLGPGPRNPVLILSRSLKEKEPAVERSGATSGPAKRKTGTSPPVRGLPYILFATSSSITSVAPPPMVWTRASRTMRSMGDSRM